MSDASPADIDAELQRGIELQLAGRFAEAEAVYEALRPLRPAQANHNLGVLYRNTRRPERAVEAFFAALHADRASAATAYSLGMALLSLGRYAEGWRFYEAREVALRLPHPQTAAVRWRGEDLTGKRLLVFGEQGLGDQIQFARFLPRLGAEATFVCSPALFTLFQAQGLNVVPGVVGQPLPPADYWTRVMSLPFHLQEAPETAPPPPYLQVAPASATGGAGLAARGDPANPNDRHRSLTPGAVAALRQAGAFVSLHPADTGAVDFLATARLVAGLDLVVTVDTSVAHLAGAMGKPVWILLAALGTDWRWLHDRADSPWYPSARLFRQPAPGDWASVIAQVRAALAARTASGARHGAG